MFGKFECVYCGSLEWEYINDAGCTDCRPPKLKSAPGQDQARRADPQPADALLGEAGTAGGSWYETLPLAEWTREQTEAMLEVFRAIYVAKHEGRFEPLHNALYAFEDMDGSLSRQAA